MNLIDAIVQGLIQGLTEFLPVSSSGHLSVFQYFTGLSSESSTLFVVLLHFGTLFAVLAAFYKTIWEMVVELFVLLKELFTGRFTTKNPPPARRMIYLLLLALLPLFVVLLFKDVIDRVMGDNDIIVEGVCFLITSLLLFTADRTVVGRRDASTMTAPNALTVGAAQAIATLPGISRSGATIGTGLLCGLERSYAVAFSFILGVPAVAGAGLLEFLDLEGAALAVDPVVAVAGVLTAAVSGFFAIKLVRMLVNSNRLSIFAWYTLVLGILTITAGVVELATGGALRNLVVAAIR